MFLFNFHSFPFRVAISIPISIPFRSHLHSHSHRMFDSNSRSFPCRFPHLIIRNTNGSRNLIGRAQIAHALQSTPTLKTKYNDVESR